MHKPYLDTNIMVDFLVCRQPFFTAATGLVKHIEQGNVVAYSSAINFVHTHYQLRKLANEQETRKLLERLARLVQPVETPASIVNSALASWACNDFEDVVQWAICQHHRVDFLITRNGSDFPVNSRPVVCDAETYLLHHASPG